MVNDQGFDVEFSNYSFFVFSNYTIEKNNDRKIIFYKSYCYKTLVGWYSNNASKRGCFKAEKVTEDPNTLTFSNGKKMYVNETLSSNKELNEPMRFLALSNEKTNTGIRNYLKNLKLNIKHWDVELYPEFLEMTTDELNNFSGMKNALHIDSLNSFTLKNKKMTDSKFLKFKQSISQIYNK
jgi:hypothetical protein